MVRKKAKKKLSDNPVKMMLVFVNVIGVCFLIVATLIAVNRYYINKIPNSPLGAFSGTWANESINLSQDDIDVFSILSDNAVQLVINNQSSYTNYNIEGDDTFSVMIKNGDAQTFYLGQILKDTNGDQWLLEITPEGSNVVARFKKAD